MDGELLLLRQRIEERTRRGSCSGNNNSVNQKKEGIQ
jgi:hypothetical protein